MKKLFKKLFIPSGEKTEVVAYKSWVVRWTSRHGEYAHNMRLEAEIFPSEEDANKFADQLREAWKLLKCNREGTEVTIEANQTKLATV